MPASFTVTVNTEAIAHLASEEWMRAELMAQGQRLAAMAAELAPKDTGAGAASIHPEATLGPDGWEVEVSWDEAHQYMAAQHSRALQDATSAMSTL